MQALMDEAGVANRLKIYEGVLHGFLHYTRVLDAANDAIDDAAEALRTSFSAETHRHKGKAEFGGQYR